MLTVALLVIAVVVRTTVAKPGSPRNVFWGTGSEVFQRLAMVESSTEGSWEKEKKYHLD